MENAWIDSPLAKGAAKPNRLETDFSVLGAQEKRPQTQS
jgi:hypothetical protein